MLAKILEKLEENIEHLINRKKGLERLSDSDIPADMRKTVYRVMLITQGEFIALQSLKNWIIGVKK